MRLKGSRKKKAKVEIQTLVPGDGQTFPKRGQTVVVHYTGLLEDGTKFDSSWDRGVPFKFRLGKGEVLKGWDQGIAQMSVGERANLICPPELAYGSIGHPGVYPFIKRDCTWQFRKFTAGMDLNWCLLSPPTPCSTSTSSSFASNPEERGAFGHEFFLPIFLPRRIFFLHACLKIAQHHKSMQPTKYPGGGSGFVFLGD